MRRAQRPVHDLPDVFRGRDAVEQGVLTPAQLRGPLVERVLHGVYRPSWVPLTHQLTCQAAALVLPADGCVTGRSAATLLGVELAGPGDPVEICVQDGDRLRYRRGLAVRVVSRRVLDTRDVEGVRVASAFRMAFDLAARASLPVAVSRLDAVVRAGLLDQDAMQDWLVDRHDNDVVHVREAVSLVDRRAESLPESQTRVVLQQAGFHLVPQHTVLHHGRVVARVDLALVELRIAVEYDGAWHALRQQLSRDRERLNALAAAGWVVVHVTASMLRDPTSVVTAVQAAVARQQTLAG